MSPLPNSLTLPHTHSLTHSPTHSLTPSLTHSLPHSLTPSLPHSLTPSLTHSPTHSLPHSLTHSLAPPPNSSQLHNHTQEDIDQLKFEEAAIQRRYQLRAGRWGGREAGRWGGREAGSLVNGDTHSSLAEVQKRRKELGECSVLYSAHVEQAAQLCNDRQVDRCCKLP